MSHDKQNNLNRRAFTRLATAAFFAAATRGTTGATPAPNPAPLSIGMFIFPRMDQIDFTGPFAVLSRLPGAAVHVLAREKGPIKDHKGLVLTAEQQLADAPPLDLLLIPGGPGQEALMESDPVLTLIRNHVAAGKLLFSVCTGALICGAAGVLKGRKATTHWSAHHLLRYFGALPQDARVVVDGNLVTAAGVTAGIDGALVVASLLRGAEVAQQIQLDIQYAPEPPFNSGTPATAPREVLEAVSGRYKPLTDARLATAKRVAGRLGIAGL